MSLVDFAGKDASGSDRSARTHAILQGQVVTSDADGFFEFTRLPAGDFEIMAGYRRDDGWLRADFQDGHPVFVRPRASSTVAADVVIEPIPVAPASRPLAPAVGAW